MKKTLLCSFATLLPLIGNAEGIHKDNEFQDPDYETPGYVITPKATTALMQEMQPTMKFGGYIMGKYSVNDRKRQATNGGFDLRFIRLYADGHVYKNFYYKFQLEVNGAPGENKGPRVLDAFIEWQKYDFLRVKLGQFKRSFGFENPMSPLAIGGGTYSQATMKLASINDRNGEGDYNKSSGLSLIHI